MFHQISCKPGGKGVETILSTVSGSCDSLTTSPEHAGTLQIMAANRHSAVLRVVEDSMRFGLMSGAFELTEAQLVDPCLVAGLKCR